VDSLYSYYRYEVIQELLKTTVPVKTRSMSLVNRKLNLASPPSVWSPDGTPRTYKAAPGDLIKTSLQEFSKITPQMVDSLYSYYRYEVIQELLKTTVPVKTRSMSLVNRKLNLASPPSVWSPDGTPRTARRDRAPIEPEVPATPKNEATFTVCVLGSSCGKSALITRLVQDVFQEKDDPTIEDTWSSELIVGDTRVILNIVDTSGHEDYAEGRHQWYTKSDAFVYVYSVASQDSFDAIEAIQEEVQKALPASALSRPSVLVGTQMDRRRVITRKQGKDLALKFQSIFYEASAASGENVNQMFKKLAGDLLLGFPDRVVPDTNGRRSRSNTM